MTAIDLAWQVDGDCVGLDPDLFFPVRGDNDTANRAKAICQDCPVRGDCLAYALATTQKHGIWGGQSENQRKATRSARHRARRGTAA